MIAAVVVVVLFAILPALFNILEIPHGGDLLKILKVIIAGLALLYVIAGTSVSGWFQPK